MDAQEILKRYADGERDFSWVHMVQVCLTNGKQARHNLPKIELTQVYPNKAHPNQSHRPD